MWLIGRCKAGDEERCTLAFTKHYPQCSVWYPKKVKIFHTSKQKASEPFIRAIRPVFPTYVFFSLNDYAPFWEDFCFKTHIVRQVSRDDDKFPYLTCRPQEIVSLMEREERLEFCDKLTRSVLLFEQLVGHEYVIPRGMFEGQKVIIREIIGAYVHFDIWVNGRVMIQNAPVTMIADLVSKETLRNLRLENGLRLTNQE